MPTKERMLKKEMAELDIRLRRATHWPERKAINRRRVEIGRELSEMKRAAAVRKAEAAEAKAAKAKEAKAAKAKEAKAAKAKEG